MPARPTFVLLIGASRVALQAHSVAEVVVGLAIGATSIGLFRALRVSSEPLQFSAQTIVRMSPVAALYAACLLLLAGQWSAEPVIDAVAAELGANLRLCRSAEVGSLHAPIRAVPNARSLTGNS